MEESSVEVDKESTENSQDNCTAIQNDHAYSNKMNIDQPRHFEDNTNSSKENDDSSKEEKEQDQLMYRQLRKLSFTGSGKFMENWNPATSKREARKINQKKKLQQGDRQLHPQKGFKYDETGALIDALGGIDLCDCLMENCKGCHFPCRFCGSQKCGSVCRCSRRWCPSQIEIEGTQYVISRKPRV